MKNIFEGQIEHFVFLLFLLIITMKIIALFPGTLTGHIFGISAYNYFLFALIIPILHQVYVWLAWRLELHYQSLSRHIGRHAFMLFKVDFLILFFLRPVSLLLLCLANKNTLAVPFSLSITLAVLMLIPLAFLAFSVVKYFGVDRAVGKDHFDIEWTLEQPLIREGIFRLSPNAMYVFGFLFLYIIALLFRSQGGLIIALFNHIYIWLHYYFTERIDMRTIHDMAKSLK